MRVPDAFRMIELGRQAPHRIAEADGTWRAAVAAEAVHLQVEQFKEDLSALRLQFALKEALMACGEIQLGSRHQVGWALHYLAMALSQTLTSLGVHAPGPARSRFDHLYADHIPYNPGVE